MNVLVILTVGQKQKKSVKNSELQWEPVKKENKKSYREASTTYNLGYIRLCMFKDDKKMKFM